MATQLAMHIPDGFINTPVSVAAWIVAAALVAVALRKSSGDDLEARAPMAGMVAAFVFAGQMLNFPVAGGTSGHLMGGVLAAVLVGPWMGALALTVVLVVQAVFFADGGISAVGLNVINMGFIPAFVGYGIFWLTRQVLPATRAGVLGSTFLASILSIVLSAMAFVGQYALGGNGVVPVAEAATAMIGVHVLIGVGEALFTIFAVGAVLSSRPDLVYGARDLPRFTPATAAVTS